MLTPLLALALVQAPAAPLPGKADLFGVCLERASDMDGDGVGDYWVGDPSGPAGEPAHGRVWLVSGRTGRSLREIRAPKDALQFGWTLAALDDVDRDGSDDVAVSAQFVVTAEHPSRAFGAPRHAPLGSGAVYIFSGSTGELIRVHGGPSDTNKIPWYSSGAGPALAAVGDWDDDGAGDLAIGWSYASGAEREQGCVRVVSGAGDVVLREWYGASAHDRFGFALARAPDVDGDGKAELAASAMPDYEREEGAHENLRRLRPGYVRLLAATGETVFDVRDETECRRFGYSLAWLPSGDGGLLAVGHSYACSHGPAVRFLTTSGERRGGFPAPALEAWDGGWSAKTIHEPPTRVSESFGSRVLPVRDFDGDGVPDVVVTAPQTFCTFPAAILSGDEGLVLARIELRPPAGFPDLELTHVGIAAAALDDLDGKGTGDFALGGASVRCHGDCLGVVVLCRGEDGRPFRWVTRSTITGGG